MAAYDYRCRTCTATFEVQRSVRAVEGAVRCPAGHDDVTRVWSAVAVGGRAGGAPARVPAPRAGGCCGGGCCG